MISRRYLSIAVMSLALPLSGFATNSNSTKVNFANSPSAILQKISSQINQGLDQSKLASTQADTNAKSLVSGWTEYFKLDQSRYQSINALSGNSGFGLLANSMQAGQTGDTDTHKTTENNVLNLAQTPIQILCSQANADAQFCQAASNGSAGSSLSDTNSANIMAYQTSNTTSNSDTYINNIVNSALSTPKTSSQHADINAATALYNSLKMVQNAYALPPLVSPSKDGKTSNFAYQPPSEMQAIHQAVLAPFSPAYKKALMTASTAQSLRVIAEIDAVNSAINYQRLKLEQSQAIVQDNQLAQEMQANTLAKANLTLLNKISQNLSSTANHS